jgi:hypothetical protein
MRPEDGIWYPGCGVLQWMMTSMPPSELESHWRSGVESASPGIAQETGELGSIF